MNASKISTDLANSVKTTIVQGNKRKAYAIRRPVNVTKRPVNAIQAPINAIQRPVNSTLCPVNAIQSLDECESSPDQLMPQDTIITSCNKPGVKRIFYPCFFFHSICSSCPCTCREKSVFFVTWFFCESIQTTNYFMRGAHRLLKNSWTSIFESLSFQ